MNNINELIANLSDEELLGLVNLIKENDYHKQFMNENYKTINNAMKEIMVDIKAFAHFVTDKLILIEAIDRHKKIYI